MDHEVQIDNLPNRLTLFRIVLVPFVVGALLFNTIGESAFLNWFATIGFLIAASTDFFDGYIARKRKMVTVFGSFLDPIADKFLVVAALIALLALGRIHAVWTIILILREFYVTSLRLLAMSESVTIPVGQLGKWKTFVQMAAIPLLMANTTLGGFSTPFWGTILIYVACFLSIYSTVTYSIGLVKKIKLKRAEMKAKKTEALVSP
jgi:CDP-diacylglycerol--glycerol-3-phosphate 3-phosphatidyltransferase